MALALIPPVAVLHDISVNERANEEFAGQCHIGNHHGGSAHVDEVEICDYGGTEASPADAAKPEIVDATSKELKLVALYDTDICNRQQRNGQEVDWSFANDPHKWHLEQVPAAKEEDIEANLVSSLSGRHFGFFSYWPSCNREFGGIDGS